MKINKLQIKGLPNRVVEFSFKTKKAEGGKELFIEGFANRAMMAGEKIIDRGMEHIPAQEWDIKEWKKNPIIFFNHNRDMPIGQGVAAKISDDGLWIKAKISQSDAPEIKKVRDLIEEGTLKTFSVGIDVGEEVIEDDGSITLKEVKLLENSVVSIPMNQESFFNISKKMLANTPLEILESKITKAKGAWVAAAVHNQIFEMQQADEEFNRAELLTLVASDAQISQGELMQMLAGNTAIFPEEVLNSIATHLDMNLDELESLNSSDALAADGDSSLNPAEEIEEEEIDVANEEEIDAIEEEIDAIEGEDEAIEEEVEEDDIEEDDELIEEAEEEDELEDSELMEEEEEAEEEIEEEKQADQDFDVSSPDMNNNETSLPKLGEVEDATDIEDRVDEVQTESIAAEEVEEITKSSSSDFETTLAKKVIQYLSEGKDQDDAISLAISDCGQGKGTTPMDAKGWEKLFSSIAAYKDAEKKKAEGDESNGITAPLNTDDSLDVNLGQPQIIALQQMNVLLGQLIGEVQKGNTLLQGLQTKQPIEDIVIVDNDDEESNEDQELAEEEIDEEQEKSLDIIHDYREKLEKTLSKFDC